MGNRPPYRAGCALSLGVYTEIGTHYGRHLFFAQGHHGIDPGGTARGDITGGDRYRRKYRDGEEQRRLPDAVDYESWSTAEGYPIAVDEFFKANISRDRRYFINFRDSRADTIFADWQNDYFVAHLRRVFKWGGFPGWERRPNPPSKFIVDLTDGLVALQEARSSLP